MDDVAIDARVSRRTLLGSAAATTAGVPLLSELTAAPVMARQRQHGAIKLDATRLIFSARERDRRWAAIRSIMAEPQWDLDAILTSPIVTATGPAFSAGFDRYLTQVGGLVEDDEAFGPVVFPRDRSTPVELMVEDDGSIDFWLARGLDEWTADGALVVSAGEAVSAVVERLSSMGARRVGFADLEGTRFLPLGLVLVKFLEGLTAALPEVEFLPIERWQVDPPDPGPLAGPAMVKGVEEQEVIRACVRAGENAIEELVKGARRGAKSQADLFYAAYFSMFEETGEPPLRLSMGLDIPGNAAFAAPSADRLREGQIISEEISARVQGYGAQVNHSIFVGGKRTPGYRYYETAATVAIRGIEDAIDFINRNPGATTGDLVTDYADNAEARGAERPSGVVIHTDGLGTLVRPRLGPDDAGTGEDDNIELVPGMAFDFKPNIQMRRDVIEDVRAENRRVQVGENILITQNGATRLGTRKLVPLRTRG